MEIFPVLPFTRAGVGSVCQLNCPLKSLLHEHRSQIRTSWRFHRERSHPPRLARANQTSYLSCCQTVQSVKHPQGGRAWREPAPTKRSTPGTRTGESCGDVHTKGEAISNSPWARRPSAVKAVERTHLRLGTRTRGPSVDALYSSSRADRYVQNPLICLPGDSTATSNTGFPESAEELYKSNAPLRSDEKLLDTFGSFQLNKAIPSETTEELPYADETLSILATLRSTRRKGFAPVALMLQVCDTIRWVRVMSLRCY